MKTDNHLFVGLYDTVEISFIIKCVVTNILGSIDNRIEKSRKIVRNDLNFLDYLYGYLFNKKHIAPNAVVSDFLQIISGYPFDSSTYHNGQYKIITIKAIQPDNFDTTTADEIAEKPIDLDSMYELNIGDVLISLTGNTGRMAIVDEKNTLLNQRVGKFVCKPDFLVYAYCLFRSNYMQETVMRNSVGTSQKNVSPLVIKHIPTYMPSRKELDYFNKVALPIYRSLINELQRIKVLLKYKSSILPLLMNGQVVVR